MIEDKDSDLSIELQQELFGQINKRFASDPTKKMGTDQLESFGANNIESQLLVNEKESPNVR